MIYVCYVNLYVPAWLTSAETPRPLVGPWVWLYLIQFRSQSVLFLGWITLVRLSRRARWAFAGGWLPPTYFQSKLFRPSIFGSWVEYTKRSLPPPGADIVRIYTMAKWKMSKYQVLNGSNFSWLYSHSIYSYSDGFDCIFINTFLNKVWYRKKNSKMQLFHNMFPQTRIADKSKVNNYWLTCKLFWGLKILRRWHEALNSDAMNKIQ